MRNFLYILLVCSTAVFSQEKMALSVLGSTPLKADYISHIDNFGTILYTFNNTLYKKESTRNYTYSNIQLGNISAVDAFNALKINLFYKNFNTVVILDNRLSEIYKIDFNSIQPYKNVTHIATGYDTTLWIFNQDAQRLELFDFKTNQLRAKTMPVQSKVLALTSNFNMVWLLTENYLYTYNYVGSTVSKIKNDNFLGIVESNGNLILQTATGLQFLDYVKNQLTPIQLPELFIKQFLVTNETLYIYDDETLHQFQLKLK